MKINVGGLIVSQAHATIALDNRSFTHGDAVKEVLRVVNGQIKDWEDHYFSLMASMRIFRMNIPLSFTPEFFQEQIALVVEANSANNGKIIFLVYRTSNEDLLKASIDYTVTIDASDAPWEFQLGDAEIDVYKDFSINTSFYSLTNTQHPEEYIAEIYRLENEYTDLVLLNADKRMAKTLKGNIFVIKDNVVKTPKNEEGVIKSVLRNNFVQQLKASEEYEMEEVEIFPFEIQKADEVFVLIDGFGIQSISQNRKKIYNTETTTKIFEMYFKD